MTRSSLRARVWPSAADDNERGMLSMVMVVTIIVMSLGALLVPIIVSQSKSTTHTDSRVQALEQAQSGIDAALGLIRNAPSNGSTFGSSDKLPCSASTYVDPTTIDYYNATIVYSPAPPTTPPCGQAMGTYLPTSATITSVGHFSFGGSSSTRTLTSTYNFVQSKLLGSSSGGQIRLDASGGTTPLMCIDSSTDPLVITLAVTPCSSAPTQQFVYASDLTLRLFNTTDPASPHGSCLQANAAGSAVTIKPCAVTGSAPANQQWRLSSSFVFSSNAGVNNPVCLAVQGSALDSLAASVAPCSTATAATATWLPSPAVGSGAAGVANNQLVNFSQFDQCAQAASPPSPTSPVTLATCDQDTVRWNQQFSYDSSSETFKTANSGPPASTYCLTSGGAVDVTVQTCAAGAVSQQWTEPGDYTIRDNSGLCLTLNNYTTLVTVTCVAASDPTYIQQLWNASSASSSVVTEANS